MISLQLAEPYAPCMSLVVAQEDDGALARRIAARRGRDAAAEAELCRRLGPRIRLYGLKHLRNEAAAADLMQDVLVMVLQKLRDGAVREPERIASFVLGACRMTVMEMRRGERRRAELLETYGEREEVFEAPEPLALDADRLAGCLEALSERERSVVVMSFFADEPAERIGAQLGLAGGNVRVIRHRAIARLRDCMHK